MDFAPVERALDEAVARGDFPGAVLRASLGGEVVFEHAAGWRSLEPVRAPMHAGVTFDLSSLTKPLATTLAAFALVHEGRLALEHPVARWVPGFEGRERAGVLVRHLLEHSSGLPAHRPFSAGVAAIDDAGRPGFTTSTAARAWVCEQVRREPLEVPPGTRALYSDLGFILLGEIVEAVAGERLDRVCAERVFAPLGIDGLFFVDLDDGRHAPGAPMLVDVEAGARTVSPAAPDAGAKAPAGTAGGPATVDFASTAFCPWRRRVLHGEVDDDNAYAMGGIAGHAGLFGRVRDVERLACAVGRAGRGEIDWLSPALVARMWTLDASVPGSTRTAGWDTPSPQGSSAGSRLSRRAVGHLGFTGTSLWFDAERGLAIVLLTNRVHPSRENDKLKAFRPLVHDLVLEAL
ncbi:MAG: serine hydrolase domain-containing protein [Alphaproteobacteria bacterium]